MQSNFSWLPVQNAQKYYVAVWQWCGRWIFGKKINKNSPCLFQKPFS
jgi:hypothetical protein